MNSIFEGLSSPRKMKRSDQIVEAVKRWVVVKDIQPGDRLPNEKALMELFECSKGTVREALKSLEVQGLIRLKTGPGGGAILAQVPYPWLLSCCGITCISSTRQGRIFIVCVNWWNLSWPFWWLVS